MMFYQSPNIYFSEKLRTIQSNSLILENVSITKPTSGKAGQRKELHTLGKWLTQTYAVYMYL